MSNKTDKWYMAPGKYDDVIVSSRVRFARNLSEFVFREKMDAPTAEKLLDKIIALTPEFTKSEGKNYLSCALSKLSPNERTALVEIHAISPELSGSNLPTGIILAEDESVSIMINEEDHLHIQAFTMGNDIRTAFDNACRVDAFMDSRLNYAYSEKYGYLTGCITNVGTGMRASQILSLPALTVSGKLAPLQDEITKFGVSISPVGHTDGKSAGFLYQITTRKTLGCSEEDILEHLNQIVSQIVNLERKRREDWVAKERIDLEDKVFRSYGVLKYTKSVNVKDAMLLLAQVKLGSDLGLFKLSTGSAAVQRMMVEIQPANLCVTNSRDYEEKECDRVRAKYLNSHLPELIQ